jgi:corrinoid protein of di/trimethylamine methyltransferase
MDAKEIKQGIYDAIIELDDAKIVMMANTVLDSELDLIEVIEQAMSPAMEEIGRRFQSGDMFLPELMMSAEVYEAAMNILRPKMLETGKNMKPIGKVVIGSVKGDIHSIGKGLVATMLKTAGLEVLDLGVDVPTFTFVEQAEKMGADIIALSALLTTTMPSQREVIEALEGEGIRDKFKVIVGGAPVSKEWAETIGADGYGENAAQAVQLSKELCKVE